MSSTPPGKRPSTVPGAEGAAAPRDPGPEQPQSDRSASERVAPPPERDRGKDPEARPSQPKLIVGIGASAGGLEALEQFLSNVPAGSGLAYVVVQHLAPQHASMLAQLLGRRTAMPVVEAKDGVRPAADHVYVIAPGTILAIAGGSFRVAAMGSALSGDHHAPIDMFLRSLAQDQGARAAGILLSGSGGDGTGGLRALKERGGLTLVQSPESAKYDSMPRAALGAGVVDQALPPEAMPAKLLEWARNVAEISARDATAAPARGPWAGSVSDEALLASLERICPVLQKRTGHDFSHYKRGTVLRRLRRHLQLRPAASLDDYVELLRHDPQEPDLLAQDLLIGITQFFRDSDRFEHLARHVLTPIIAQAKPDQGVRIWVPGCASGEEAYSIGILVRERLLRGQTAPPVQIFATDIDAESIAEARRARYPADIAEAVSPERLARFFVHEDSSYLVAKEVREMCIFSEHSLIRDPPFLGLDLISCRNLLIYLDAELQKKLVLVFHYALKPGGYLFLGPSESLAGHPELFETVEKRWRLFRRLEALTRPQVEFPLAGLAPPRLSPPQAPVPAPGPTREQVLNAAFERLMLQEYVPPGAVVNERGDLICVAGLTGSYLQPPAGVLSTNVLDIAHASLRIELRTALHAAARSGGKVVRHGVPVEVNGSPRQVRLTVRPMPGAKQDRLFAVIIQEQASETATAEPLSSGNESEAAIEQLESELRTTRADLRTTIEELESSNEELRSSNEELLSTNEELQSTNEELQSSQEELKSVNEELSTVNAELGRKVEELSRTNSDLANLFSSTNVATLFLDREQRVTRFTPAAKALFRLIDADEGRPLADLAPRFVEQDLTADVGEVLRTLQPIERPVETVDRQAWYLLRITPYRTIENVIAGAVVTLADITEVKKAETDLRRLATVVLDSNDAVTVHDLSGRILQWNRGAEKMYGYSAQEAAGMNVEALIPEEGHDQARAFLTAIARGDEVASLEVQRKTKDGRKLDVWLTTTKLVDERGRPAAVATTERDISQTKLAEAAARARAAAELFRRAIEEAPIPVIMHAEDGEVLRVSRSWTELTGYTQEGMESLDAWLNRDYVPGADAVRDKVQALFQGKAHETGMEFPIRTRDGQVRHWSVSASSPGVLEDGRRFIVAMAVDITDRKRAEDELRETKERLEDADRRKNEFLAMLSHELRNPLAPIRNSLYVLDRAPPGGEQARRAQAIIDRQVSHMTRLIDDLLDVTRISRGKIQLQTEPLELNELAQRAVEDHRGTFIEAGVELSLQTAPGELWVNGDRTRLAQVIGNLLQNSVKFTPRGGRTTIGLEEDASHEQARVLVRDTGRGIPKEILPRLFEAFTQADVTLDRAKGGLGLGLALVKGLVEMHGGTVQCHSPGPDQGATFTLVLPLTRERKTRSPKRAPDGESKTSRVLVIDDNSDVAESLREVLEIEGHVVEVANGGWEGLQKARAFHPDYVICDIGLPGMDGYEVARAIRADPELQHIGLIALSGYAGPDDVAKAREAGFDSHLAKPATMDALDQALGATGLAS